MTVTGGASNVEMMSLFRVSLTAHHYGLSTFCSSLVTLPCDSNILKGILEQLPGYEKYFWSLYLRVVGVYFIRVR